MYRCRIHLNKKLSVISLRTWNIKKTRHPYVEPQVKDAQTIETETRTIDNEFSKLKQEFDKVNNAVTEQKLQDDAINLI